MNLSVGDRVWVPDEDGDYHKGKVKEIGHNHVRVHIFGEGSVRVHNRYLKYLRVV
jgi:hypothetical protein